MHLLGKQIISQQPQTITQRPQLSPYLEGEAAYVIIPKPCQLISGASVTCNSQKKRGENSFPSHLCSGRQIEASLGGGWKPGGAGWRPENQNRWRSGLCTWNTKHVHMTQMVRKLSLEQAKCLCYILSLAGELFTLPAAHRKEASVWFAGITVHVEDKSVNADTLFSRWKRFRPWSNI